jgi:hypothetical protein
MPQSVLGPDAGSGALGPSGGSTTGGLVVPGGRPSAASLGGAGSNGLTSAQQGAGTADGGAASQPPNSSVLPGGVPLTGFGFNSRTVQFGITTNKDAQAALSAVGISSGSLGDQEQMVKAVLSDINAQGGVLGRKVVPVFHDVKTTDTSTNPQGAAQAACSSFTEDSRVAAVLELVLDSRLFAECMIKHHVFVVGSGLTFTDQTYLKGLTPYYFRLASPLAESLVPTLLSRLTALGYFSPWDTVKGRPGAAPVSVGLFHIDEPAPTRAFNDISARLKHMGYKVTTYAYGRQDASYQNAVLKFQTQGVTHVIGDNASYAGLMTETNSQGYYPRYGMTSYNGGGVLLQQAVPASALAGALGVGWAPSVDVDGAHDPGPTGPAYKACLDTMHKHQVEVTSRAALAGALGICDGLKVLAQSMNAGKGFDGPHITSGRGLFSFETTATFSSTHNEGSVAMPSAVRDYAYRSDCKCFVYVSKTNRSLG